MDASKKRGKYRKRRMILLRSMYWILDYKTVISWVNCGWIVVVLMMNRTKKKGKNEWKNWMKKGKRIEIVTFVTKHDGPVRLDSWWVSWWTREVARCAAVAIQASDSSFPRERHKCQRESRAGMNGIEVEWERRSIGSCRWRYVGMKAKPIFISGCHCKMEPSKM